MLAQQYPTSPNRRAPASTASGSPLYQPSPPRGSSLSPYNTARMGHNNTAAPPPSQPQFSFTRTASRQPHTAFGVGASTFAAGGFSLKPTHARTRSIVPPPVNLDLQYGTQPPTQSTSLSPPAQLQQRQSINTRLAAVTQQYTHQPPQQYAPPAPEAAYAPGPQYDQAAYSYGGPAYGQGDVFSSPAGYTGAQEQGYVEPHHARPATQYTYDQPPYPSHVQGQGDTFGASQQSYHHPDVPDQQYLADSYFADQNAQHDRHDHTYAAQHPASVPSLPDRHYTYNRASISGPSAPVSIATDGVSLPLSAVGGPRGYKSIGDRRDAANRQSKVETSPQKSTHSHSHSLSQTQTSPVSAKRSESRRSLFSAEGAGTAAEGVVADEEGQLPSTSPSQERKTSPNKLRRSRSSDLIRRLSRKGETISGGEYVPVETDAAGEEEQRYQDEPSVDHHGPAPAPGRQSQQTYGQNDDAPLQPPRISQFSSQHTLSHSDSMPLLAHLPSTFPMPPAHHQAPHGGPSAQYLGAAIPSGMDRQYVNPSPGQYDDPASSEFPAVAEVPVHAVHEEEQLEDMPWQQENREDLQLGAAAQAEVDVKGTRQSAPTDPASDVYNQQPQPHYTAQPSSQAQHQRPNPTKRISDPITGLHSRNTALFEAERGGKALHFYEEDGTWSANSLIPTPLQKGDSLRSVRRRSMGEALVREQEERDRLVVGLGREEAGRPLSAGAPVGHYAGPGLAEYAREQPYPSMSHNQHEPATQEADLRSRPWSASTDPHQPHPLYHPDSYNSQNYADIDAVNLEAPYSNAPSLPPANPHNPRRHVRSLSEGATLLRHGTLLHPASDPERAGKELGIMLGNRRRRLSAGKILPAPMVAGWDGGVTGVQPEKVKLELAKKGRARVEVDVVLERECVVEGGEIRGRIEVRVGKKGVRVGMGKVRVVGYEDVSTTNRHIFYQHAHTLPVFDHPPAPNGPRTSLFAGGPDHDGFRQAAEGFHFIPFSMRLPLRGGAKGAFSSPGNAKGPAVRYVVVGSIKVLDPTSSAGTAGKRSIAHFYRPVVVLPYLNPGVVLAPSEETVEVVERRGLGWSLGGNKGSVELRIALGRSIWVSGQRVWCEVGVRNDSSKRVKSLTLALLQTVTTFLPDEVIRKNRLSVDKDGIPNADEALGIASTTRRKVAEETIEADDTDWGNGQVTGKQWWTGVQPGEMGGWDLSLLIPNGMITIPRSRLVEVTYTLRLTANGSIYVDVPIVLINFLSIDPPPMPGDGARLGNRIAVSVDGHGGQLRNVGVASTSGHSHPNEGANEVYSQHSGDSFRGIARASSTTLHIDALLAAGKARAEQHGHSTDQDARARQHRPQSMYSDYTPEPTSSRSQLGTMTTSRSMPGGMREGYHNKSIDRRRALPVPDANFDPSMLGGATPSRPKVPRVMSYLSVHSSELDQPLSDEEADQDEDDEIGKTLREAARREGRKMSLAALTRAAAREKADAMGDAASRKGGSGSVDAATPNLSTGEGDTSGLADTTLDRTEPLDASLDTSDATPKAKTLQVVDHTPGHTPNVAPSPSIPTPAALEESHVPVVAQGRDVRAQIDMHTPTSDGLEQIDEVNEESSQVGQEDGESFRVESAYGGLNTDDEAPSRPDSTDVDYTPTSTRLLQGYSEDLLQPIAVLPELSLDDVLSQRKWSVDLRAEAEAKAVEQDAQDDEDDDDDDKPLALLAKASPRVDCATTPKKQSSQHLPDWREQERTPTGSSQAPMSPPFAYDFASPDKRAARLPTSSTDDLLVKTPVKMYEQTSLTSSTSLGGTGLTTSTNRAPSRKGSALDPQMLLRVGDERDPPTFHLGRQYGSFAASTSAISDQESEVGQVVQAVKRNLSVHAPVSTVHMDSRYADEGNEEDHPQQSLSISPESRNAQEARGGGTRYGRTAKTVQGSPIRWEQDTLAQHAPPVQQMHGPRTMGGPSKGNSYFLDARRRSSGISPRTNYQPVVGEPMMRGPSANTPSALRHQIALQPPVSLESPAREKTEEESALPPLAPSIEGDSSSDGHGLDSPQMLDTPGPEHDRSSEKDQERQSLLAHQQLLQSMRNIASPTPKAVLASPGRTREAGAQLGPKLDPGWVPGDHLLHTEVAFARTSFSLPAGPTSDDTHSHAHTVTSHHSHSSSFPSNGSRQNSDGLSPLRRPSMANHGTMSSHRSGHGHGRATSPTPTSASIRSMKSAHSSHSVVLSGMQYKLQHMQARDEALRKFSVASAASSGRRESMLGEGDMVMSPQSYVGQGLQYGHRPSMGGQGDGRVIKPRKSYTTALGPRGG